MPTKKNIVDFPAEESKTAVPKSQGQAYAERWGHGALFNKGYVVVPTLFLRHYATLKPFPITPGEALFILHLMEFKWDAREPFPGYKLLGRRMGVSDKMARRYAKSLETKKYLRRRLRIGQTNRFDLVPLFDAILKAAAKEAATKKTSRRDE